MHTGHVGITTAVATESPGVLLARTRRKTRVRNGCCCKSCAFRLRLASVSNRNLKNGEYSDVVERGERIVLLL